MPSARKRSHHERTERVIARLRAATPGDRGTPPGLKYSAAPTRVLGKTANIEEISGVAGLAMHDRPLTKSSKIN